MSALTPEPTPVVPVTPATEPPKPTVPPVPDKAETDWQAEAEKWKTFARKHEDASKANAAKAQQFDAFEESQKTEQQKLTDRATAAEAKVVEIEARALRAEVASTKGVPVSMLTGTTKEELEASADEHIAWKGIKPPVDFGGGARGADVAPAVQLSKQDVEKLFKERRYDEIEQARKDGRIAMGPPQ